MDSLGIAIDGSRYVRIDSRISDLPRNVRLRTVHAGQDNALLRFCHFRSTNPKVVKNFRLSNLDRKEGETTELRLRIERRSFAGWEVRISRDGFLPETVNIRTRIGLWPLVFPVLGLIVLIIWLLLSGMGTRFLGTGRQVNSTGSANTLDTKPAEIESPKPEVVTPEQLEPDTVETDTTQIETPVTDTEANDPEAAVPVAPLEPEVLVLVLPEPLTIFFEPESAVLSSSAHRSLERLAGTVLPGTTLIVEGYSADYGTERGQLALSRLRAANVAAYLENRLSGNRTIEQKGYGVSNPVTREREKQELNRRVVINFREQDQ